MGYGGGTSKVEVTVVAPAFTDPNAVAEIVNQYLTDAIDRGTLRGLAVA
jgi:stress-induced morphogen